MAYNRDHMCNFRFLPNSITLHHVILITSQYDAIFSRKPCQTMFLITIVCWKSPVLAGYKYWKFIIFLFSYTVTIDWNRSEYQNACYDNPKRLRPDATFSLIICLKQLSLIKYSFIYSPFEGKYPRRDNLFLTFENCPFFTREVKKNYFIINRSVVADEF